MSEAVNALRKAITEGGLLDVAKKTFGFAFSTDITEKDGKLVIRFIQQDSGNEIMTLDDLSAMLQMERSVLRDKTEARAQQTDQHPIPFFKVGRALRFVRSKIITWLEECQKDSGVRVSPPHKGKLRRAERDKKKITVPVGTTT